MDRSYSSIRQDHRQSSARHRRENPSFSSTLLDAIYRSIDAGDQDDYADRDLVVYRETMRKNKQSASNSVSDSAALRDDDKMANFRRACIIEKWMEKKVTEKVVVRRSSAADFDAKVAHRRGAGALMNSSSSSSESSSGGGFSSSESESLRRPKPIRTSVSAPPSEASQFGGAHSRHYHHHHNQSAPKAKPSGKHESLNGFVKTKSKALKIYGDLKKVKQPISPGGRLASFLNSLFTNASHRKSSKSKPASASATACSSASSFSRSCLSNASTKFSDASSAKRSVRFCPVSVIVGEDCRPCGQKSLFDEDLAIAGDRRRVQEVAIDLLKSYQKKSLNDGVGAVVEEFDMRDVVDDVVRMRNDGNASENDNEDDDDDDDAASYSSSDLFELDNLSAIGIDRYREELPVYETTHFDTNRAIASGLIL